MKISRVDTPRCLLAEGLVWDASQQALYYLDIGTKRIHRHDPCKETTRSWDTPMPAAALAMREPGELVVAMKDIVAILDEQTGTFRTIAVAPDQPAAALFNDGTVDARGRFLLGSCSSGHDNPQPIGGLYSLGSDHVMTRLDSDITHSNGPCLAPDGRTLYFSDSFQYSCFAYDYDLETGRVSNRRLFADTRQFGGMPDGATVDRDGVVWMAIFRGGKVVALCPDGRVERVIDMPVGLTVSTAFGGPDFDVLYVATIDPAFFKEPAEAGSGYIYQVEGLGARGLPRPRYVG